MAGAEQGWRRCSACKNPIDFEVIYWVCNVSTCNRKRTGLVFCSVSCWEVHLPTVRHRETWAVERRAPSRAQWAQEQAASEAAAQRKPAARSAPAPARVQASAPVRRVPAPTAAPADEDEVLIIASRLKSYVRAHSGMNTSDRALGPLSDIVRKVCDEAIRNATRAGRKTVLDRDIPPA